MKLSRWFVMGLFASMVCAAQAQQQTQIVRESAKTTPAEDGAAMFSTYCAVCHGTTGKGNGPAATALKRQPADLTQLTKRNNGSFPAIKVGLIIKGDEVLASHGSRDMPIWGKIFIDMEGERLASLRIHNLTEYVRTLQEK
jgi:mono/diheme cytochrome c family protein